MTYLQPGIQTYSNIPTTTYVGGPASTTYLGAPATTTYVNGPITTGTKLIGNVIGGSVVGPSTHLATGTHLMGSVIGGTVQRAVAEEIPVESRIEYIPFEKKYIEYDRVERIERVPFEREIVEYEEVVHAERIPVERTITDYYAVETQIEYIPKEIEETIVEYEPIERTWERVQYLPVETQIVHYPEREKYIAGQTRVVNQASNALIGQAYQYAVSPATTTTYAASPATAVYQYATTSPTFTTSSVPVVGGTTYISGSRVLPASNYVVGAPTTYNTFNPNATTTTYVNGPTTTYVAGGSRAYGGNIVN